MKTENNRYKCGHSPRPIIVGKGDVFLCFMWKVWEEENTNICFSCYREKNFRRLNKLYKKL